MTRPAVAGLNHVTLAVASLDRALAFYVDLLGCRLRVRWDGGAYLTAGELWLCLSIDEPQPSTDYTHVALTIDADDLDTWHERLRAAQVVIWKENASEGVSVYCLDPDGHRLELHAGDLGTRLSALQARPYAGLRTRDVIEAPFASVEADAVQLLLVAGSVRAASVNRAFVRAIVEHVPTGVSCERFEDFDRLPPFSPDRDRSDVTYQTASGENELALADWLGKVRAADVVLFTCPEYAGGLPGTVKNGLDHLVGSDAFIDKPFVLVNLAPRAHRAQEQLTGVLTTMSGRAVHDAFVTLDVGSDASCVADRLSASGPLLAQSFAAMRAAVGELDAMRATATETR